MFFFSSKPALRSSDYNLNSSFNANTTHAPNRNGHCTGKVQLQPVHKLWGDRESSPHISVLGTLLSADQNTLWVGLHPKGMYDKGHGPKRSAVKIQSVGDNSTLG